jgi:hypothetical protein
MGNQKEKCMLKLASVAVIAVIGATMSACYVVPLNQYPNGPNSAGAYNSNNGGLAIVPMPAYRPAYTARLYPGNPAAAKLGGASGVISNPEQGHGEFTFSLGGESYAGEATRAPNSSKGVANASGNRGGFVRCDYIMSSSALGSGSCTFASGARYDMHISQ